METALVSRDPEVMSGALCFTGTRVLVKSLFDYLEGSSSLEDFLEDFPSVSRDQAVALLKVAREPQMRLLLDESVPARLFRALPGHQVSNAVREGWSGVKNGKLLAPAATAFDAFITVDKNLPYQQNLKALPIAVIVLDSPSNELKALLPLIPALERELETLVPRTYVLIRAEI